MQFEDAILRQCGRCRQWRPVSSRFKHNARLCVSCGSSWGHGYLNNGDLGLRTMNRAIAITDKGKALLRQWRRQELREQQSA